ncbi:MAG: relaxase/mobilization nuclease domain-containing protein [Bacteroides sp.]|nr:relaxase/mobilization nuclease domain-containing protein [Bacteroides sp.]
MDVINLLGVDISFSGLKNEIDSILDSEKTRNGLLTGTLNCDVDTAFQTMVNTKKTYGNIDMRQGYQITVLFDAKKLGETEAVDILRKFAQTYIGEKYECVYAIHNSTEKLHGHLLFNSVSRLSGEKYLYMHDGREMQKITDLLCKMEKEVLSGRTESGKNHVLPEKRISPQSKPCRGMQR